MTLCALVRGKVRADQSFGREGQLPVIRIDTGADLAAIDQHVTIGDIAVQEDPRHALSLRAQFNRLAPLVVPCYFVDAVPTWRPAAGPQPTRTVIG
jgi:hypothetical protein